MVKFNDQEMVELTGIALEAGKLFEIMADLMIERASGEELKPVVVGLRFRMNQILTRIDAKQGV